MSDSRKDRKDKYDSNSKEWGSKKNKKNFKKGNHRNGEEELDAFSDKFDWKRYV